MPRVFRPKILNILCINITQRLDYLDIFPAPQLEIITAVSISRSVPIRSNYHRGLFSAENREYLS